MAKKMKHNDFKVININRTFSSLLLPNRQNDLPLYSRYMELMEKSSLKWLTDGRIDTKKNIQISLGSNLPLSNEMTFILVFSMLCNRDPHQLFELLCLQLRSIVKAYSQGLQELITESCDGELQYNPTELLNCRCLNG